MKTCSRCKIEKPLDLFSRNIRNKDGKCGQCKACNRAGYAKLHPPVLGLRKPRAVVCKEVKRQDRIAKYGIEVVETLESQSGYYE